MNRSAHLGVVIALAVLVAAECGAVADWAEWDPGGDPSIPYWLRGWTFWSDVVVVGVVADVWVADPMRQAVTFVSLLPREYIRGDCPAGEVVFYYWGATEIGRLWSDQGPVPAPGDTLLAWIEFDARGELFNRRSLAIKRGPGAWTARDDEYGQPAHDLSQYMEWARSSAATRTPEHLAKAGDMIAVVFVQETTYAGLEESPGMVASLRVERGLYGVEDGATVEVGIPYRASQDKADVRPGERLLVFLESHGNQAYRVLGGRDGAYVVRQGTRCFPVETRSPPVPGLPCDKCGIASRCEARESTFCVEDVEALVQVRKEAATSN